MTTSEQPRHVAVLVGSLRAASFSRKVARALMERAPRGLTCELVEIGDLPLYNEDLEQGATPPSWLEFRSRVRRADGLLFVTPEYNRSLPGCLKNALDVGSRPSEAHAFDRKPAAVVSVTPYRLGAFGANHALRQTFVFLNLLVMQQPEAYISDAASLFDDAGSLTNQRMAGFLDKFMGAFAVWIETVKGGAQHDFESFLNLRREAASAYVRGDGAPIAALVTAEDPATFYSPAGDVVKGAREVSERHAHDVKAFRGEGTTQLEILHSGSSGDFAYWTGLQHAEVETEKGGRAKMTLRVTEVFRFEDGAFKLIHRHADPAKE